MQLLKRQKRGGHHRNRQMFTTIFRNQQTKKLSPLSLTAEEVTNIKQFSGYDITHLGVLGMTLHATHTRTQTLVPRCHCAVLAAESSNWLAAERAALARRWKCANGTRMHMHANSFRDLNFEMPRRWHHLSRLQNVCVCCLVICPCLRHRGAYLQDRRLRARAIGKLMHPHPIF